MKTPDIRPWMAVGLAMVVVSASGCCGRGGIRFAINRNCCCPPATSCKQAATCDGVRVADSKCEDKVVAQTIRPEPVAQSAPSVLTTKPAQDDSQKLITSRRQNNHNNETASAQVVNAPSTDVAVVRDNDKLQSIVDPEFIRHLALTPVPPNAPEKIEIAEIKQDNHAAELLAGTQLLDKPPVFEEIPTPAEVRPVAKPAKPPQPEKVTTTIVENVQQSPIETIEPAQQIASAQILTVANVVVLRAVVPDSLMQARGGFGPVTNSQQVHSPIGSGIPVLPASFGPNRGETWIPTNKTQQLPPDSWTKPSTRPLNYQELEPRILKAVPTEAGSGLSGPATNQNGVEKSANAASISTVGTGK